MCWLCDELGSMPSCTDCGILICFDVKHGDDVISPARMTDDGDVLCEDCYDRYQEEEAAELDEMYGPEMDGSDLYEANRTCPRCGGYGNGSYQGQLWCESCGASFGAAVGFSVQTAAGNTAHVLADPDMDPETAAALEQLIDAAHQAIEDGTLKPDYTPDDRPSLDDIDLPF